MTTTHQLGAAARANLTRARKEGWNDFVNAPKRERPDELSKKKIRNLSEAAAEDYLQQRCDWHNNLGPFNTPQLAALHKNLRIALASNTKDGNRTKEQIAISGFPAMGKTTGAEEYAKHFQQQEIRRLSPYTGAGDERIPVVWVGMRGKTGMTTFNQSICDFYAHPGRRTGNVDEIGRRALDLVLKCETRLLVVDDVHFLHFQRDGGAEVINQLKFIANEFPVTILSIGIGVEERGILKAGTHAAGLAQLTHWATVFDMPPYTTKDDKGRRDWKELVATFENRIVLGNKRDGMLLGVADYLHQRTNGFIGSLSTLIRRACAAAIITGSETITQKLLAEIKIDSAAELAYRELRMPFGARMTKSRHAWETKVVKPARATKTGTKKAIGPASAKTRVDHVNRPSRG